MRLLIGADLVPTKQTEQLFIEQDQKTLFGEISDLIKKADRTIVNLECALTKSENAIKKFGPNLKADPRCADALKSFGVTDIVLSNNHVFDFGIEGLQDTLNHLDRVGIAYTGVGENDALSRKPHIIEQDGKKVGFVNVCEHEYTYALPDRMGANPFDPFTTMQDIYALKKEVDFVIVLYHGGKEHCRYPSPRLHKLCRAMVDFGADVVITQHSHCIGCYENCAGGHIVHGQGNFHFCMDGMKESWYSSLLLELEITDKIDIRFHPIICKENGMDLAKATESEDILKSFYARNEELKNGKWQDGWHEFCMGVKDFYEKIVFNFVGDMDEKAKEFFAHYLDCEAHTDV
ncbi:MAG: CapA family protein [Clostridia bacterium]|nr:CapA family protein [Clostridia bacterium]